MDTIVITRHAALVEYLKEQGIIDDNVTVIEHATADAVRDKHVIGVLPVHLATLTAKYTNLTMNVPQDKRGQELTLDEVREYAGDAVTYEIRTL